MSNLSDFAGASVYPNITPSKTYIGPANGVVDISDAQNIQGFVGDGDYFVLPSLSTASITYNDSDGNQVTTGSWAGGISPSEIDAAADNWCGFMLDETDSLLYVMVCDVGATPDEYLLASIDVAGVITQIGVFSAPATAFTSAVISWRTNAGDGGSSNLHRVADGSGNFFLRANNGSIGVEELEFNSSTGAIVGDVVEVAQGLARYKTPSGVFIGGFSTNAINRGEVIVGNTVSGNQMSIPPDSGLTLSTIICHPMQWNGRIVMAGGSGTMFGSRAYEVTNFDNYGDALGRLVGAI